MARFTHIYQDHIVSRHTFWKYLKGVIIIPAALIIAWVPIIGIYEVSCKLGEAGIETKLTKKALEAEQRIRLQRVTDDRFIDRIIHEFEEVIEFYALLK